MKYMKIISILAAALFIVSGCDFFLTPPRGRENPNDPDNPAPGLNSFAAYGFSANSIKFEWDFPEDIGNPPNVVVIRNASREPEFIDDGTVAYDGPSEAGEEEGFYTAFDESAETESDYYFAIWSYTTVDGENFYKGPLYDTATTRLHVVDIMPMDDGYAYYDSSMTPPSDYGINNISSFMDLYYDSIIHVSYILLSFDFYGTPKFGELVSAELNLYFMYPGMAGSWEVAVNRITQSWDWNEGSAGSPTLISNIQANSFADFCDITSGDTITLTDSVSDMYYSWNISDIIQSWMIYGEPIEGIIVRKVASDTTYLTFNSIESADEWYQPYLQISYYGDDPPDM